MAPRVFAWNPVTLAVLLGLFLLAPPSAGRSAEPEPLGWGLSGGDEEIVREFKKYFRKYKDTPTRVEAVISLETAQTPSVVKVLLPLLKDDEAQVVDAAVRVLAGLENRAAIDALLSELEDARSEPIVKGLLRAVTVGSYSGATPFVQPALGHKSWAVRRGAVLALTAVAESGAADLIAPLCADGEVAVRGAALEALAELKSELVVEPALGALADESWQVRASAIHSLGKVRRLEAIGPLIELMGNEEGRLREDIGRALGDITGRNFGQRLDGWVRFWERYSDRFVVPTDEELAKLRKVQAERQEHYSPTGALSYHGIESPTRSVLFVIDTSGSMENEVVDRERFADGDYPSFSRMDIVKTELQRTIEGLEPYVRFNILSFATDVKSWKKDLVAASPLNKSSAIDWAGRLEPLGGKSREHLAQAGLGGAAGLEHGKTNTHGALMRALDAEDVGRKKADYETEVDTIFFLSDGRPSTGLYVDTGDILEVVKEVNELRKIVIHTIAIGQFRKEFMRGLAESSGGVFVDLGQ